jgi:hypothetical protein
MFGGHGIRLSLILIWFGLFGLVKCGSTLWLLDFCEHTSTD